MAASRSTGSHPIGPGSAGENLTVEGLDWSAVRPGMRFAVGEALLEITGEAPPCKTVAGSFRDGDFTRMSARKHPGWGRLYARVLRAGLVREGDSVEAAEEA